MISRSFRYHSKKGVLALSTLALILCLGTQSVEGAETTTMPAPMPAPTRATNTTAVVSFRKVVENSKLGKQQQASFEGMKHQMESLLQAKEKEVMDLWAKTEDPDVIDGLTPEKEQAMKQQAYQMAQELEQGKQQFLQTLQQANTRIIQMLNEDISKAAAEVAQARGLEIVFNEESVFYHKPTLNISDQVIARLDETFDRDAKQKIAPPADTQKLIAPPSGMQK